MEKDRSSAMSPYIAGALAGLLLVLSVWVAGKYFGASTTFVRSSMIAVNAISPEHIEATPYYAKYYAKDQGIDWQWLFVLGIFLGSFIVSNKTKTYRWQKLPDVWEKQFGPNSAKRSIAALIGGFVLIFGARLAGGCPSGHGLSGLTQLSVSGYISLIFFFVGGIIMTRILYRGGK